ncbi:MAG: hypothetical protein VW362_06850, partial [Candidatus Nanopelagicales bacterium]
SITATERPYTQLTVSEFSQVKDIVDGLWQLSRTANQQLIEGRRVSRDQVLGELNAGIAAVAKPKERSEYTREATKWEKFKVTLMDWRASLRRVEHWVHAMDRGNFDGPFRKYIWEPITQAANRYRQDRKRVLERYLEVTKMLDGRLGGKEILAPELEHKFGSRAELIGALLHTGNQSNLSKLLAGRDINRPWGEIREDGTLDTTKWDAFIRRMWAWTSCRPCGISWSPSSRQRRPRTRRCSGTTSMRSRQLL